MISERHVKSYCKEDITKIENYDKAIYDTKLWVCHHRDEVKILPSGIKVIRSKQELIENGRYYNCPANELIFLTQLEHMRIHHKGKSVSTNTHIKMSTAQRGRKFSDEHRRKLSNAHKGIVTRGTKGMTWKLINGKRVYYKNEVK